MPITLADLKRISNKVKRPKLLKAFDAAQSALSKVTSDHQASERDRVLASKAWEYIENLRLKR